MKTTYTEWRDVTQGSPEWHDLRRGELTASTIGRLIVSGPPSPLTLACPTCGADREAPCLSVSRKAPTPIKTIHDARTAAASTLPPVHTIADGETFEKAARVTAAERIAGLTEDIGMTRDMYRGVESEPFAREYYAEHYAPVTEIGFALRTGPGWRLGCSPDGLVGDDGGIEIKSPRAASHVAIVLADEVPTHWQAQIQANLLVTGRDWWDFIPFSGGLALYRKRITPNPDWQGVLIGAARAFEAKVTQIVSEYLERTAGLPKTEPIPDLEVMI